MWTFAKTHSSWLLILHTQRELRNYPELPFWRKMLAYGIALILSPIRPLFIAEAYEENKAKRKSMINYGNKETNLKLYWESLDLRKNYSDFIRVEIGLEVLYQLCGQVSFIKALFSNELQFSF